MIPEPCRSEPRSSSNPIARTPSKRTRSPRALFHFLSFCGCSDRENSERGTKWPGNWGCAAPQAPSSAAAQPRSGGRMPPTPQGVGHCPNKCDKPRKGAKETNDAVNAMFGVPNAALESELHLCRTQSNVMLSVAGVRRSETPAQSKRPYLSTAAARKDSLLSGNKIGRGRPLKLNF